MPAKASRTRARAPLTTRPRVTYTRKLALEFIDKLARGTRLSALERIERFPCRQTAHRWAKRYPEFGEAFREAMRLGADARADRVVDIAEAASKETLAVDRFHAGSLRWHVERDGKIYGLKPDEPDLGAGRALVIHVRQFERVVRDDGTAYVREVLPSGETIDLD